MTIIQGLQTWKRLILFFNVMPGHWNDDDDGDDDDGGGVMSDLSCNFSTEFPHGWVSVKIRNRQADFHRTRST